MKTSTGIALRKVALACTLALGTFSTLTWAQTADPQAVNALTNRLDALENKLEKQGLGGLTIKGQMDPTYIWTSHNKGSFNFADDYSTTKSTYENGAFGRVIVDVEKAMDSGTVWSLRLNANKGAKNHIDKAMVTVPMGEGMKMFAGLVPDWSGYEYGDAILNKFVTHNLAYDYLFPSYYLGAGFEITSGSVIHKFMVGNLNQSDSSKLDQNAAPVIAYRFDWSKGDFAPFATGWGVGGSAQVGSIKEQGATINGVDEYPKKKFGLIELDFYNLSGAMEYYGNVAFGEIQQTATDTDDAGRTKKASWMGIGGLVVYRATPQLSLLARADYIKNSKNGGGVFGARGLDGTGDGLNGFGTPRVYSEDDRNGDGNIDGWVAENGAEGVNRYALSVGANYVYDANTQFKLELRHDWANGKVFGSNYDSSGTATEYKKSRNLIGASVVVNF